MASDIQLVNLTTGEILTPHAASKHLHRKYQENAVQTLKWTCCPNCEHWKTDANKCGKFNALPPALVIATGCEEWAPDLPF